MLNRCVHTTAIGSDFMAPCQPKQSSAEQRVKMIIGFRLSLQVEAEERVGVY